MDLAELFESIDLGAIQGFVEAQQQEGLHLDFVELGDPRFGKADRRNLAEALSGFANSAGGLLIWGVAARRDADGVDAACEPRQIENARLAHSRLESLTGECVNPVVDGVRHKRVPENDSVGYLVTYVPESDAGPHMAKSHIDRYYKRSGDSFYRMEHFDIADMFGRRRKPRLSLSVDVRHGGSMGGSGGTTYRIDIVLGIRNTGRGMARFPRIELDVQPPYSAYKHGLDGNGKMDCPDFLQPGAVHPPRRSPGTPAALSTWIRFWRSRRYVLRYQSLPTCWCGTLRCGIASTPRMWQRVKGNILYAEPIS